MRFNKLFNYLAGCKHVKKILIIERGDIADVLSMILSDAGYHTVVIPTATNVEEVLPHLPDVVFVHERNNHQVKGTELIKLLKADGRTKDIPVILGATHPDIARIARECGADSHLAKPFDITLPVELVKRFTEV